MPNNTQCCVYGRAYAMLNVSMPGSANAELAKLAGPVGHMHLHMHCIFNVQAFCTSLRPLGAERI